MLKKILCLVIIAFSLVACRNKIQFNAELYDDAGKWMNEEFLKENLTYGAFFEDVFLDDNSYPRNITHLIKNKEDFNAIFAEFPSEIDFTKSLVCIFIFTSVDKRPYEINKIFVDNQVLKIEVKSINPKRFVGDAVPSWQRCLVVVLDKFEITSVEFTNK